MFEPPGNSHATMPPGRARTGFQAYRLRVQIQRNGMVNTVSLDVHVTELR
jgi:hypothetical protein